MGRGGYIGGHTVFRLIKKATNKKKKKKKKIWKIDPLTGKRFKVTPHDDRF